MAWPSLKAVFRKLFRTSSHSSTSTEIDEIGPDTPISEAEPVVRFITSEDRVTWKWPDGYVKERQFHPDKRRNEVSSFRVLALPATGIQSLGEKEVVSNMKEPSSLIGWGTLQASVVKEADSNLFLDTSPDLIEPMHPRHAAIRGWPENWHTDNALDKARMKSIAQFLASKAALTLTDAGKQIAERKAKAQQ
jgi:hypothetical protein